MSHPKRQIIFSTRNYKFFFLTTVKAHLNILIRNFKSLIPRKYYWSKQTALSHQGQRTTAIKTSEKGEGAHKYTAEEGGI